MYGKINNIKLFLIAKRKSLKKNIMKRIFINKNLFVLYLEMVGFHRRNFYYSLNMSFKFIINLLMVIIYISSED